MTERLRIRCKFDELSLNNRAYIFAYELKHNVYFVEVTRLGIRNTKPFLELPKGFSKKDVIDFYNIFEEDFCNIFDQMLEDYSLTDLGKKLLENLKKELQGYLPK